MKKVITKSIKVFALLLVLYLLIGFLVPPMFQKGPIALDSAEKGGAEQVLCIDDNREALLWRLRLIDGAEQELVLSTFDFRVDNSGKDMLAALYHAAKRGVEVRILVDGIAGGRYLRRNELVGALASVPNVQIKLYNPIDLLTPWKLNYRLHDKYLIADGKRYLLGGRNTNDLFLGEYKEEKDRNIDREILVCAEGENSSTEALRAYFAEMWELPCNEAIGGSRKDRETALQTLQTRYAALRETYPEAYLPSERETERENEMIKAESVVLLSDPISPKNKAPVLWQRLSDIMERGERILIETPYIICNDGMYETLTDLCAGGRQLQIMTNAAESGANPFGCTDYLNEKHNILATGSEIFEVSCGQSLHTKTILVDDRISIVGSYNFDIRSTYLDTELMLVIDSPALNQSLREDAAVRAAQSRHTLPDGRESKGPSFRGEMPLYKKVGYFVLRLFIGLFRHLL